MRQLLENIPFFSEIPVEIYALIARIGALLALLLIAWLLRRRIARLFVAPIRAVVSRTRTGSDDFFLRRIERVIGYIIFSLPLYFSLILLPMSNFEQTLVERLASTLLLFAVFRFLFDLATDLFTSSIRLARVTGYRMDPALLPIARLIGRSIAVTLAALSIAQVWGWNIAGLVAGVGLGGLAISLAAKDILDDLLGYAVIIMDNICRPGEYIVSPHTEGIVEEIGARSTRVRRLDQGLVTVPNKKLSDDWVVNWSRLEKRWFNFFIGLTYSSTAGQIRQFIDRLSEGLKQREYVDADSVVVLFTEYGDSSLNVLVRCYVALPDWVDAHAERQEVNLLIMQTLEELGLEVAFPTRSLYIEDLPDGLAAFGNAQRRREEQDDSAKQQPANAEEA